VKNEFDPDGFCGTFDGFGNWEWTKFEEFMELFAQQYNVKDIGVYEFQFVPPSWIPNVQTSSIGGATSTDISLPTSLDVTCKADAYRKATLSMAVIAAAGVIVAVVLLFWRFFKRR
jgi:hypothetical protein